MIQCLEVWRLCVDKNAKMPKNMAAAKSAAIPYNMIMLLLRLDN